MAEVVKPVRRIVAMDDDQGRGVIVQDGPSPDMRSDPARPGFASTRLWVTDQTPARTIPESLHLPHTLEPPARGSVFRMVTFPPDAVWQGKIGTAQVRAHFEAMGSPGASTYSPQANHPYMHKKRSLDFVIVMEGEITLVLDTEEVHLRTGDTVVQRGTNHAWSNRTNQPCILAITSHDGRY